MCTDVAAQLQAHGGSSVAAPQGQGEQGGALCTGAVPAGLLGLVGGLELQEQG